ncbi:MAG: hypothetical protein ACJ736_26430 [Streptomyces sp.]
MPATVSSSAGSGSRRSAASVVRPARHGDVDRRHHLAAPVPRRGGGVNSAQARRTSIRE